MCDYPGCKQDWTISVGEHELKLCDVHKDKPKFPRGQCDKCGRTVEVGTEPVVNHKIVGKHRLRLCSDTCAKLERRTCDGCDELVLVDGISVVNGDGSWVDGLIVLCGRCTVAEKCRVCGAPAAVKDEENKFLKMFGAVRVQTVDGQQTVGWRCAVCATGRVKSESDADPYYRKAVQWMAGWAKSCGREYPDYGNRLSWELGLDSEFEAKYGRLTPGSCKTTGDKEKKHKVMVLNYISPLTFQTTLLHELTHALTAEFGCGDEPLIEGFCEYVPYLFLGEVAAKGSSGEKAEARRLINRMEKNSSQEYGQNFRTVRDALKHQPIKAIDWFEKTDD